MNAPDNLIDQLARAVAAHLPAQMPVDIALWDGDYIAALMQMKPKYFKEQVATAPGFPQAIRVPLASGGRSSPRWKAEEVIEWMGKNQERRAA
jgi:hypothetical protein